VRIILLGVLLAVLTASPALGSERSRVAVALAQWRFPPLCDKPVVIQWFPLRHEVLATTTYGWNRARTTLIDCFITLNSDRKASYSSWYVFCSVLLHEHAHLTREWNNRHSDNPRSLMYPRLTPLNFYRRCGPNHRLVQWPPDLNPPT
jgi:hypothetical protein